MPKSLITSKDTALTRETMTSETGDYSLNQLTPGAYKLTVTKEGFATSVSIN
jgi:uncharacterized surface anchored protein